MAALTRYLQESCSFVSVGKHVTSFTKAMFTANFRSIYCYKAEEGLNKVTADSEKGKTTKGQRVKGLAPAIKAPPKKEQICEVVYEVTHVLPTYLKSWLYEELSRHRPLFKSRSLEDEYPELDVGEWITKFKIMFTQSRLQLRKKTKMVKKTLTVYKNNICKTVILTLPFQTYLTLLTLPNLPFQTYLTLLTLPNLPFQTHPYFPGSGAREVV